MKKNVFPFFIAAALRLSASVETSLGDELRIGVLAERPKEEMAERLTGLAEAINAKMVTKKVVFAPMGHRELEDAIQVHRVDFVMTNPGHYIFLRELRGLSGPLATAIREKGGRAIKGMGGVVFTLKDRGDLNQWRDLQGKRIACVGTEAAMLGGFQLQRAEMVRAGVDFRGIRWVVTAPPQDQVVKAVAKGDADAGFVSSDTLDEMRAEGKIDAGAFKVLEQQRFADFPLPSSTPLYPYWPVAAPRYTNEAIRQELASALLGAKVEVEQFPKSWILGFTVPESYEAVEKVLREAKAEPYGHVPEVGVETLVTRYKGYLWGGGLGVAGVLLLSILVARTNRKLAHAKARLENEVVEKEKQKQDLTLTEEKFRKAFFGTPLMGIISTREAGEVLEVNEAFCQCLGYERKEVVGHTAASIGVFEKEAREHLLRGIDSGREVKGDEITLFKKDGRQVSALVFSDVVHSGGREIMVSFLKDNTEKRLTLSALKESKERLLAAIETAGLGFFQLGPGGVPLYFDQRTLEVLGLPQRNNPEESFQIWIETVFPGDRTAVERGFQNILGGLTDQVELEYRYIHGEKGILWIRTSVRANERSAEGGLLRATGIVQDITLRKEAEEETRKTLESISDAFFAVDAGWKVVYMNKAAERVLGFEGWAVLGADLWSLLDLPQSSEIENGFREAARGLLVEFESQFPGREQWVRHRCFPRSGGGMSTYFQDTTEARKKEQEKRSLESQVSHLQRLEGVAALTGGIAHDMNNVLGAILTSGELVIHEMGDPIKAAGNIVEAAKRGRALVQGLMEFSRKELGDSKIVQINDLVEKERELLERTTLKKVEIIVRAEPRLPAVQGSEADLSALLMNLCINSLDAMGEGGRLVITTRGAERDGSPGVELVVEDNGCGMDQETLAKAMDPFFTTKGVGKGTGLGLSRSYGIAKAHGGDVRIQSKKGVGTRVVVFLPLGAGSSQGTGTPKAGSNQGIPRRKSRNILVVDDDKLVRESMVSLLSGLGHRVLFAEKGEDGVRMVLGGRGIDLVILDRNMPGFGGLEALRQIKEERPLLPVVLATGDPDEACRQATERFVHTWLMVKPFSLSEIKERIDCLPG